MLRLLTSLNRRHITPRLLSTTAHNLQTSGSLNKVEPGDVKEEEISLSKFQNTELLPEVPITSLDISKRIERIEKKGSFTVDIFKGAYDDEFLIYPDTLYDREENEKLKKQAAMVRQMFPQIWDDDRQLQKFNFFNLFQLSVSEMMTIFESIGASTRTCTETTIAKTEGDSSYTPHQIQVSKSVISLIIRNCLTYWPMFQSSSTKVRGFIPQKHILFGGSSDDKTFYKNIGFCWTEQAPGLGSLPPQEWLTMGTVGGAGSNHTTLITGRKTRILHDDSIEHYLVYYRDKILSDAYESNVPADEPNPASDPFVGCCLVHKSQLKISAPYYDSAGCSYVDIDVDTTVPADQTVFTAKRRDPFAVNIKALGQLATSAVIMGILKDTMRMTYQHLLSYKPGLLDCDIIQRKLTGVTSKIFALESMVYYIAGMYDGLKDGFDAHMETTVLKVIANEYAYECLKDLQDICSSDMFIISKIQDQINMFDSFLDGNIYNRLYLATMGVIWFARSKNMHLNQLRLAPWYPGYYLKSMIRERAQRADYLTLNADIYGHLHPSLKDAGEQLEYIVKRVKYASESLVMRFGKDVTGAQSALYRLSQLSIDCFMLTAMCARASKSYCNGSRNSEIDVHITTAFAHQLAREVRLYVDAIDIIPYNALENRAKMINDLNIKHGGYYAESPLDPNI